MIVLLDVALIDGTGAPKVPRTNVVIESDRIAAISSHPPAGGTVLDCAGKTLIPGLINCHVHVMNEGGITPRIANEPLPKTIIKSTLRARAMLRAGITACRDVSGIALAELSLREAIDQGLIPGPRLRVSGKRITMTGGFINDIARQADGPDDVRRAVREQLAVGADCVKLVASKGILSPGCEIAAPEFTVEELRAGVEEAYKWGKQSAAHAQGTTAIKNAIRAGVTSIEHGNYLDDEALELMVKSGTFLVPTLTLEWRQIHHAEALGLSQQAVDRVMRAHDAAMTSYHRALEAGVQIALGSDAGTHCNPHHDIVTELRLAVDAGQTAVGAIRAATSVSAKLLGLDHEIGSVAAGKKADLVLLDGDPEKDIGVVGKVWKVFKDGQEVE